MWHDLTEHRDSVTHADVVSLRLYVGDGGMYLKPHRWTWHFNVDHIVVVSQPTPVRPRGFSTVKIFQTRAAEGSTQLHRHSF